MPKTAPWMVIGLTIVGVATLIFLIAQSTGTRAHLETAIGSRVSSAVASKCEQQLQARLWTCSVARSDGTRAQYRVLLNNKNCFTAVPTEIGGPDAKPLPNGHNLHGCI